LPYALDIDVEIGPAIVPWSAYMLHDGLGSTGLAAPTVAVAVPVDADAAHFPVKPLSETLFVFLSSKSATTSVLATAHVRAPLLPPSLPPPPPSVDPVPMLDPPLPVFDDPLPLPLATLVAVIVEMTVVTPPSARVDVDVVVCV